MVVVVKVVVWIFSRVNDDDYHLVMNIVFDMEQG